MGSVLPPRVLFDLLRIRGPLAAREVLDTLAVSQPTLSRLARGAAPDVVRIGRARRSLYAATREVRTLGRAWDLHRVRSDGHLVAAGRLHALHARAWWYEVAAVPAWLHGEFADGVFPDLPWFLDDLRPQGFLGRAFARRNAGALGLGPDPRLWDADGILAALLLHGDDLPGDWIVGDAAAERAQRALLRAPDALVAAERVPRYEALAAAAMAGDIAGLSAGGEQPKFAAYAAGAKTIARHVLVKFSPPLDTPPGRRWADLLRAEHLAAVTLRAAGIAASDTEWLAGSHRAFLEVARFDRIGSHGRRGVVSLFALEAAHYGALDAWAAAADRMERDGWLAPDDAETLRVLWWFGRLIANSDLHFANVSLLLDEARPLRLAPAYDMLPMHYRPGAGGEIVDRPFEVVPPPPRQRAAWTRAARMAAAYWHGIDGDPQIGRAFRELVAANGPAVLEALGRFGTS